MKSYFLALIISLCSVPTLGQNKLIWQNDTGDSLLNYPTKRVAEPTRIERVHKIYCMGNSITAAGYYESYLEFLLGSDWAVINKGISGQWTAEMLARFNKDIIAPGDAEYVIILGGVNDMIHGSGDSTKTIEANLEAMYSMAHNAGIKVVAITLSPFKAYSGWTADRQATLDSVNVWMLAKPANADFVIDGYAKLGNPAKPDSLLPIYDSGDGLHPSVTGSDTLAAAIYFGSIVTDIVTVRKGDVPKGFSMSQNYPNPFNPNTTISYQLRTNSLVVLRVFDVLGRAVQTLVNERQGAGEHSVRFDAPNLPSGVYFYRLEAGTYHDTKKLLLLK